MVGIGVASRYFIKRNSKVDEECNDCIRIGSCGVFGVLYVYAEHFDLT